MDNLPLKKTQVDVQLLQYILLLLHIPKEELMEIRNNSESTNQSKFTMSRQHKTGYIIYWVIVPRVSLTLLCIVISHKYYNIVFYILM